MMRLFILSKQAEERFTAAKGRHRISVYAALKRRSSTVLRGFG
jgi:hypothetical protein